jgi:GntR family transcriptional regulator
MMTQNILAQVRIDKHSAVPIYQQLQDQLEKLIVDGTWRLREPLPSETAIARRFRISVMTVRQAMAQLVNKGLIYREKGRGTFITPQPLDHHLQRLESFTEDMRARGLAPSSQVLTHEIITGPGTITTHLGLDTGAEVLHLKRLRLVEERPVALHDAYVSRLDLEREELEAVGSLYVLLAQKGVELMEAEETLEAVAANSEMAKLLGIMRNAPLLKASRLSWDRDHIPIEIVYAFYRADFYRYAVRLRR